MKLEEIADYYERNWPIYVKWWKADKTYESITTIMKKEFIPMSNLFLI